MGAQGLDKIGTAGPDLTLPRLKRVGFLAHRGLLAVRESDTPSPSVFSLRVPHGGKTAFQDVQRGVVVPVKNSPAATQVRAGGQRLFNSAPTATTVLRGVVRRYCYRRLAKHAPVVFEIAPKHRPRRIRNTFSEVTVFDHVEHLEVFVGDEVVRHYYAPRRFYGVVFTLPRYLEVFSCKLSPCLAAVTRAFFLSAYPALQPFKLPLGRAEKAWVRLLAAFRVGIERLEPNVQADRLTRRRSILRTVNVHRELNIVAVGFADKPHPLDEVGGVESEVVCPLKFQRADTEAVGESDAFIQGRELPAGVFVLNAANVLFELRIALFHCALFATVVKAAYRRPSAFGGSLAGGAVKFVRKVELFSQHRTIFVQVVLADLFCAVFRVYPETECLVLHKLSRADSLVYPAVLFGAPLELVVQDQHAPILAYFCALSLGTKRRDLHVWVRSAHLGDCYIPRLKHVGFAIPQTPTSIIL